MKFQFIYYVVKMLSYKINFKIFLIVVLNICNPVYAMRKNICKAIIEFIFFNHNLYTVI